MTVYDFKRLNPKYKNIEGEELWNAMEDYMLNQNKADETLKQIMPIWKTHTFRWLYYRIIPNLVMGKISSDKYTSDKRCMNCKIGVNARMGFIITAENGDSRFVAYCPNCKNEFISEPNKNLSHKVYNFYTKVSDVFWLALDKAHLVRSSISGRYDMFGDEARYVKNWVYTSDFSKQKKLVMHKRKWWEYILIEKPHHNF